MCGTKRSFGVGTAHLCLGRHDIGEQNTPRLATSMRQAVLQGGQKGRRNRPGVCDPQCSDMRLWVQTSKPFWDPILVGRCTKPILVVGLGCSLGDKKTDHFSKNQRYFVCKAQNAIQLLFLTWINKLHPMWGGGVGPHVIKSHPVLQSTPLASNKTCSFCFPHFPTCISKTIFWWSSTPAKPPWISTVNFAPFRSRPFG